MSINAHNSENQQPIWPHLSTSKPSIMNYSKRFLNETISIDIDFAFY